MKIKKYDLILGFFILFEICLCYYIGISANTDSAFCSVGSDCETVQNSIYGTLFGIKLAWFGVLCFSILFILFLIARANKKLYWMFFASSMLGAGFAIYFISLHVFVLKKICNNCVIIDGIMILMFVIVIFEFIDFRKEIRGMEKSIEVAIHKQV